MTREFIFNGLRIPVQIEVTDAGVTIDLNKKRYVFTVADFGDGRLVLQTGDSNYRVRVARQQDRIWVWLNGSVFDFRVPGTDDHEAAHSAESGNEVRAPMPGTLVKVFVSPGDTVEERQVVAIVEAMKMEHQLRSPRAGIVETTSGSIGTTVDTGTVIVALALESNL